MPVRCVSVDDENHNSHMISVAVLLSSISVWTAKQLENDNVDGEHFNHFRNENSIFKLTQLSADVPLVASVLF